MRKQQTKIQRQKQIITRLKNENAKLREEVKKIPVLEKEIKALKQDLEKSFLLIEELRKIIFGKAKKKKDKDDDFRSGGTTPRKKATRNSSSYRREIPKEEDITDEVYHRCTCLNCQSELTKLKDLEFFTEDILPPQEWFKVLKKITCHHITTGYCPTCQKRVSPIEIPKQKVTLGENIRQLITFQATVQQLSYSQIIDFTKGLLQLKVSEGEIANILENQALKLEAFYLSIKNNIQSSSSVHLDETSWPTVKESQGNYAWVVADAKSEDVLYSLGQSRGKGNVEKLLGKNYSGIGTTDNYGAYRHVFKKGQHALCWAHPFRKIRDLKDSSTLPEDKRLHCQKTFQEFSILYDKVRAVNARPFSVEERKQAVEKINPLFDKFILPDSNDPHKLKQIKLSLIQQKDCYFVCLLNSDVSPDNNKAERALRHLVVKRKKCFGSKTQKGADTLSIIYSVIMSLWRKSKEDFFSAYSQALKV